MTEPNKPAGALGEAGKILTDAVKDMAQAGVPGARLVFGVGKGLETATKLGGLLAKQFAPKLLPLATKVFGAALSGLQGAANGSGQQKPEQPAAPQTPQAPAPQPEQPQQAA
jgi:hypothetical protein